MAEQRAQYQIGYRVVGTVRAVRGACHWGHRAGDVFELSGHDTAGLCGFFYHNIFPYIMMLQFGGGFPRPGAAPTAWNWSAWTE